jgi:hypothetical protein
VIRKRGLIKKGLLLGAVAGGILAFGASPANAIPTLPGPGVEMLTVLTYIDNNDVVIGQTWFGCPGVPLQHWGSSNGRAQLNSVPCGPTTGNPHNPPPIIINPPSP